MARTNKAFYVEQGSDWKIELTVSQADGTAADLTGATLRALLKNKVEDADADAVATITTTIVTAASGRVRIELSDTQTAALAVGEYVFDLAVETASGQTGRPLGGTLTVYQPVTQALA